MSKRKAPKIGKCVHCLQENVVRNWDHVFPESWYPETTPANTAKWLIPSCYKCNKEYGQLEQDLMMRLSCCIDPESAAASGISYKVLRSMDVNAAKNPKDAVYRDARRNKFLANFLYGPEIPINGIYPGLGERWGREKNSQIALIVPAAGIKKLCEKIIRGIYYIENEIFIEPPYKIDFYVFNDKGATEVNELLERFGVIYQKGPGIIIKRALAHEDGISGLASIQIWGELKMFASITNDK